MTGVSAARARETPGSGRSAAPGGDGRRSARTRGPYAALDLGTNNCRLLIALPSASGFRVIDAYSKIVRLGQGLAKTGRLSEEAIRRTMEALRVCRDKMDARGVTRARLIATEACRAAANGAEFLAAVRAELGMELEVVDRQTEALLAVAGCRDLADPQAKSILLFDIGGGSTELIWLGFDERAPARGLNVLAWESIRVGVVTVAESFGGVDVDETVYRKMMRHVDDALAPFVEAVAAHMRCDRFHLLGTSGTVTTIAGIHLNLPRYDRRAVDGLWLERHDVEATLGRLRAMSYAERVAHPCIGAERGDLVLPGCAIFDAIQARFPSNRLRIADRGLREGMLMQLMREDRARGLK